MIDNDSSVDDSDIMSAAAEKINEIMDSNINEDSPLYPIIARELIGDWTSHIFRNWYTGDAAEEDYYLLFGNVMPLDAGMPFFPVS